MLSANEIKALRDIARQQMEMMMLLNNPETYNAAKVVYSNLCADYFDAKNESLGNVSSDNQNGLNANFEVCHES
jgi:hypothetical protein